MKKLLIMRLTFLDKTIKSILITISLILMMSLIEDHAFDIDRVVKETGKSTLLPISTFATGINGVGTAWMMTSAALVLL